MKPYALLEFTTPALRSDFKLPSGKARDNVIYYDRAELPRVFTESFLESLESKGMTPHSVLIFHQLPFVDTQRIHIDNKQSPTSDFTFAINWIFCEGECAIQWFTPKLIDGIPYEGFHTMNKSHEAVVDGEKKVTSGYRVTQFDPEMVELSHEVRDKGPLLIRANIPHHGVNFSAHDRWSVSLRVTHHIQNQEQLFDIFNEWIIDDRT